MNLIISVNGHVGLFLELGADGMIQDLGIENLNVAVTSVFGVSVTAIYGFGLWMKP